VLSTLRYFRDEYEARLAPVASSNGHGKTAPGLVASPTSTPS
jgi:hypothetical protein